MLSHISEWIPIKIVAENLFLSREMVYKLAQRGELPAVRFGSSWRIHRDDLNQWLSRKRSEARKAFVFESHRAILKIFKEKLLAHFGSRFNSMYLFGSAARGTQSDESDIDVLIVLGHFMNRLRDTKLIRKTAYEITFGQGKSIVLSPLVTTLKNWETKKEPLFLRIHEEGLLL